MLQGPAQARRSPQRMVLQAEAKGAEEWRWRGWQTALAAAPSRLHLPKPAGGKKKTLDSRGSSSSLQLAWLAGSSP